MSAALKALLVKVEETAQAARRDAEVARASAAAHKAACDAAQVMLATSMPGQSIDYKTSSGGTIQYKAVKSSTSLSQKLLRDKLPAAFKDQGIDADAKKVAEFLWNARETKESWVVSYKPPAAAKEEEAEDE
jgi:hypothetical protein